MAIVLYCCLLACTQAQAIIIRHDRADADYRADPADFPQVFPLYQRFGNQTCVATVIDRHWAITAGHCATQSALSESLEQGAVYPVTIAGVDNAVSRVAVHPQYGLPTTAFPMGVDLALLRLAEPVTIEPLPLLRRAIEPEQVGVILGWGFTGVGSHSRRYNDSGFRRATNRVSRAAQWLEFRFDEPGRPGDDALPLEGVPGLGDSGGPALLELDGDRLLMGVARGELVETQERVQQGLYGGTAMYERISLHLDWIEGYVRR